jgi:hypothetical protein
MAIVASGYLFSDDTAFHVDVFQGDTPCSLMARHAPGSIVKSAAVLDVDVPGQTLPVALDDDEPVVVVGSSPRTSVFVYAETPDEDSQPASDSEGEPSSPLPPPTIPPPPLATYETKISTRTPAELMASAMETIQAAVEHPETGDSKRDVEVGVEGSSAAEGDDVAGSAVAGSAKTDGGGEEATEAASETTKVSKTRRVRKLASKRGTRRAARPVQIELI